MDFVATGQLFTPSANQKAPSGNGELTDRRTAEAPRFGHLDMPSTQHASRRSAVTFGHA